MGVSTGRGVDNTVAGWVTDYALFAILLLFSARLRQQGASIPAMLTQLFMAGGYLFGGLGHHVFPNRAVDSPCGDHNFYGTWLLAYSCQAASCIAWCVWADRYVGWKWTRLPMLAMCATALVSGGIIVLGSLWCLLSGAVRHQPTAARYDVCKGERPKCDEWIQSGELLFYAAWGGAWSLVAFRNCIFLRDHSHRLPESGILRGMWLEFTMSRELKVRLLHMLNLWAPFALFAYGPFLIIYVVMYALNNDMSAEEGGKIYAENNIGLVYHCGVLSCHLCTYYVSQNLELLSEDLRFEVLYNNAALKLQALAKEEDPKPTTASHSSPATCWRDAAPPKDDLIMTSSLCHLMYWWRGPEHRSLLQLRGDAGAEEADDALIPPMQAKGCADSRLNQLQYFFRDKNQVLECVKDVVQGLSASATCIYWSEQHSAAVFRDSSRLVVAFRGTVTADEWLKDCKLQMTKSCGGLVHSGFLQHLDTVYEPLKTTVMNALADNGTVEVLLTGHSLGAAAATIFASKLQDLAPLHVKMTLITFGSPRVGNSAFTAHLSDSPRLRHYRVQNELDPCTRLPWWLPYPRAYRHHGHHVWLHDGIVSWRRDSEIASASWPLNPAAYLLRRLWSPTNNADVRFHKFGGDIGYREHIKRAKRWVDQDRQDQLARLGNIHCLM